MPAPTKARGGGVGFSAVASPGPRGLCAVEGAFRGERFRSLRLPLPDWLAVLARVAGELEARAAPGPAPSPRLHFLARACGRGQLRAATRRLCLARTGASASARGRAGLDCGVGGRQGRAGG